MTRAGPLVILRHMKTLNVLGTPLEICCQDPTTGWYRDGFCHTDMSDPGMHSVCCVATEEFLAFSKARGNDLSTPRLELGFPGVKPGQRWCVCAARWFEAYKSGQACPVILEACHEETLAVIPLRILEEFSHEKA